MLALWRGIEAAADARGLLHLCGSIDIAPARGSSAASDALGALQDACKVRSPGACLLGAGRTRQRSAAAPHLWVQLP